MNQEVTRAVIRIKKYMLSNSQVNEVTLIRTGGGTYQLFFATNGCRYACTVCSYGMGKGHVFDKDKMLEELEGIIANFPANAKVLVLETSGSFMDNNEIDKNTRNTILKKIRQIRTLEAVVIETHYTTVSEEVLEELNTVFEGSSINVELEFGVESINPEVLEVYNKDIDTAKLLETIWKAKEYGINCELNFMLGAPVLTAEEQIEDVLNSIEWVIGNCPEDTLCVLFPINIKRHSLLYELWENGWYEPISHWAFVEMLLRIPKEYLGRVLIAWYGNRYNVFDGVIAIIYPSSCDECHDELQRFYEAFYTGGKEEKIELLEEIRNRNCRCREDFSNRLKNERGDGKTIKEKWKSIVEWLKNKN